MKEYLATTSVPDERVDEGEQMLCLGEGVEANGVAFTGLEVRFPGFVVLFMLLLETRDAGEGVVAVDVNVGIVSVKILLCTFTADVIKCDEQVKSYKEEKYR